MSTIALILLLIAAGFRRYDTGRPGTVQRRSWLDDLRTPLRIAGERNDPGAAGDSARFCRVFRSLCTGWVGGGIELLVAAAVISLWWLPSLFDVAVPWGLTGNLLAQLHARTYAQTVIVVPRIGDRPRRTLRTRRTPAGRRRRRHVRLRGWALTADT